MRANARYASTNARSANLRDVRSLGKVEDFNLYLYLETATKIPSYRREAEPVRCVLDVATMSRSLR